MLKRGLVIHRGSSLRFHRRFDLLGGPPGHRQPAEATIGYACAPAERPMIRIEAKSTVRPYIGVYIAKIAPTRYFHV